MHFTIALHTIAWYGKSTTTLNSYGRWRCIFCKLWLTIATTESECPIIAHLAWLLTERSSIFHHASAANNCQYSQWRCIRTLAVVSRAVSDPDSPIWHGNEAEWKPWPVFPRFVRHLCSQRYYLKCTANH